MQQYAHVKDFIWCQEEPQNQGAWYQIRHRLQEPMSDDQQLYYAGRPSAAAPASGIFKVHLQQQQALVEAALGIETKASKSAKPREASRKQEMTIEIKVPQLPESVSDATLVAWHQKAGDAVARDENLVDLETDKVVLEVPAPASGVLQEIKIEDGATVVAGDVLAILAEGDAKSAAAAKVAAPSRREKRSGSRRLTAGPIKTSPAVRRLLEEHDLDATMVTGLARTDA